MLRVLLRIFLGSRSKGAGATGWVERRPGEPKISRKHETKREKPKGTTSTDIIKGQCYVIDGDTIAISGTKIRLAGIDAPELDHPWGNKSRFALIGLCRGTVITAVTKGDLSYDRIVAKCYLPDGTDIAAELVKQGLALDWFRFSGGEYRHLEPLDARKKLWRADAKQKGRLKNFDP